MDYLPIFIRITGQTVLVVGGGQTALRKATLLMRAGANIRLVAIDIEPALEKLLSGNNDHDFIHRAFEPNDLEKARLAVAATNDEAVNKAVFNAARSRHLPVNVVDNPELCDFIFPSIVDRSPVVVAVSSSGKSPMLARLLRARLETFIPSGYGKLASLLGEYRAKVKGAIPEMSLRMRFWEKTLDGPIAGQLLAGKDNNARQLLDEALENAEQEAASGEVYLVGAGPGDPDLLTFRALRLMQQADVVLYDRLVAEEILHMCRQDAEKIHVGKQRKQHTMAQEDISKMLVELARQGKRVLRLKGGDPFIFGRGGEEISELADAKIPFQVVPGITAASGCASYAGIPLTHRDYSQSVRFVTGHLKNDTCDLDWNSLVQGEQTLVFYMGLIGLPIICKELVNHGMASEKPIALIQQGTTPNQKVYTGTLATMPEIIANNEVRAPTLIIVGDVVSLHDKLSWK
ncbi:MAG: siroheme synthase CysG [Gammaproteobacteria bacterium]|nr:siroheme synthase CysG [Gammaproteobacteria bacterium]